MPDIQFFTRGTALDADLWFPGWRKPYADGFTLSPVLLHPEARGRLYLRSADPREKVRIVHNFFSARGRSALAARRRPHRPRRGRPRSRSIRSAAPRRCRARPPPATRRLDGWIRRTARSAHHPSCTCAMGTDEARCSTPTCACKGIDRLRVVDASAMPDLVTGNINACVLMIAEKGAELIRGTAERGVRQRYAVFASLSPSSRIISSRIRNFCTLPVTVIGKASTKRM